MSNTNPTEPVGNPAEMDEILYRLLGMTDIDPEEVEDDEYSGWAVWANEQETGELYKALTPDDYEEQIVEAKAALSAHIAERYVPKAEVLEREDAAFKEGQRVGQYQAADKLYHWTTTLYLFKDDLLNKAAEVPQRLTHLLKDCEKLLNHNSKVYHSYVRGDRYKRLHPRQAQKQEAVDE